MSKEDIEKITFLEFASDTQFLTHTLIQENPIANLMRRLSEINFAVRDQLSTVPNYYDRIIEDLAMIRINDPSIQEQLNALMNVLRRLTPKPSENMSTKYQLPFETTPHTTDATEDSELADIALETNLKELQKPLTIIQQQLFIRDQLQKLDALEEADFVQFMSKYWGPDKCEACIGTIAIPRSLYFLQTLYSAVMQSANDADASTFAHYDFHSLESRILEILADMRNLVLSICKKITLPTADEVEEWHKSAHYVFINEPYGDYRELLKRIEQSSTPHAPADAKRASPSSDE